MLFEEVEIKYIEDKLRTECSEFMKIYDSGIVLYHGTKQNIQTWKKVKSPEDRIPTTSDEMLSIKYNDYLLQKGFKSTRSNSIYTTKTFDHASSYGKVVRVFPVNGAYYHFTSKKDLILSLYEGNIDNKKFTELINLLKENKVKILSLINHADVKWLFDRKTIGLDHLSTIRHVVRNLKKLPEFKKFTDSYLFDPEKQFEILRPKESQNPNIIVNVDDYHEILIHGTCYFIEDNSKNHLWEE